MGPYSPMMPAVSNRGFGNGSQPLIPPATKLEGRKAIRYRIGSVTMRKEMKPLYPLEHSSYMNCFRGPGLRPPAP